jgi:copper chaperone CopZ
MQSAKLVMIALALGAMPIAAATAQAPAAPVAQPAAEMITAKVSGMVCDFCAQAMKKVFSKEAAVSAVAVDLDKGEVRLTMKPGQTIDDAALKKLIAKSGYALTGIERTGA